MLNIALFITVITCHCEVGTFWNRKLQNVINKRIMYQFISCVTFFKRYCSLSCSISLVYFFSSSFQYHFLYFHFQFICNILICHIYCMELFLNHTSFPSFSSLFYYFLPFILLLSCLSFSFFLFFLQLFQFSFYLPFIFLFRYLYFLNRLNNLICPPSIIRSFQMLSFYQSLIFISFLPSFYSLFLCPLCYSAFSKTRI